MKTVDFSRFVASEDGKYHLSQPFVQAGFRCATDRRIAIRVPDPAAGPDTDRGPDMAKLFQKEGLEWHDWPADWRSDLATEKSGEERHVICSACGGRKTKCPVCDGSGTVECVSCGADVDCHRCDGAGHVGKPCMACGGEGFHEERTMARRLPNGTLLAEHYLERFAELEGLRWAQERKYAPVFFRWPGGEIALMPLIAWRIRKHDIEKFADVLARWGRASLGGQRIGPIVDERDKADDGQMSLPIEDAEAKETA